MSEVAAHEALVEYIEATNDPSDAVTAVESLVEYIETDTDPAESVNAFESVVEYIESDVRPPPQWYPAYVWDGLYWVPLFPPGDWPFAD